MSPSHPGSFLHGKDKWTQFPHTKHICLINNAEKAELKLKPLKGTKCLIWHHQSVFNFNGILIDWDKGPNFCTAESKSSENKLWTWKQNNEVFLQKNFLKFCLHENIFSLPLLIILSGKWSSTQFFFPCASSVVWFEFVLCRNFSEGNIFCLSTSKEKLKFVDWPASSGAKLKCLCLTWWHVSCFLWNQCIFSF